LAILCLVKNLEFLYLSFSSLNKEITQKEAEGLYSKFRTGVKGERYLTKLIESLLLLATKDYEEFLKLEKSNLDVEKHGMLYYCYLHPETGPM